MTDDPMLALAHTMVSSPGVFALLLGSGVSRASGIPTGWEITLGLVRDLAVLQGQDAGADPAAWYKAATGQEPDYSALLEQFARATGERRNLLERFFEPTAEEREEGLKRPTEAHRVVARLMARGFVRVVLTTNFDRLLEDACAEEGIAPVVISSNDNAASVEPLVHQRHVIVKLHGDYKDPRIMNTVAELATYQPDMDKLLDQVLGEFGLVVCGWSGDWDAALRAGFARVHRRRYSAFWASLTAPTGRGAAVADGRGAAIITIKDADAFFRELEEKVLSLEDLRAQRPSSTAIAVATLKRYIVEDRYRIRSDDLVRQEAVSVAARAASTIQDAVTKGTSTAAAVTALDANSETLRALYFHGCRTLRDQDHEDVFLNALQMMAPSEQPSLLYENGPRFLRAYTCGTVLLAGAYGALAKQNWRLLRKLLMLPLQVGGERLEACKVLTNWRLLPTDAIHFDGQPRLFAAEHLRALALPLALEHVPDPQDLYHRLEIWCRLAFFELPSDQNMLGRAYPGCFFLTFVQPGRLQPEAFFAEADAAAADWAPFKAGWFGGSPKVFAQARSGFTAWSERMKPILMGEGII
ncbi:MAG: SIR2 family protein [Janthinobacterium lividum]